MVVKKKVMEPELDFGTRYVGSRRQVEARAAVLNKKKKKKKKAVKRRR